MRLMLHRHPESPASSVKTIEAEVERWPGQLAFRFIMTGQLADLKLMDRGAPQRRDGLWRSTCFEAFVRSPGAHSYLEFNVAPFGDWAAYAFDDYREGMRQAPGEVVVDEMESYSDWFELRARAQVEDDGPLQLGLTAVIEEADGRLSYWALAHPQGLPDFHHPDCFALELPALDAA